MPTLKLKIPPPLVASFAAALMWLVSHATPALSSSWPFRRLVSSLVSLGGAFVAAAGMASFRRARTTINPLSPERASSLVTTGIYRHTRNPMYLGLLLALTGYAFFLSNPLPFLFPLLFILYMNKFQIEPEESILTSKFGPNFAAYKSTVRRWL